MYEKSIRHYTMLNLTSHGHIHVIFSQIVNTLD